jgi:aryl-alcohol dehydrogenase-like predicted oxidoreductase
VKLGLGTVQFGADYGVSNQLGQTTAHEATKILEFANTCGISYLDTAPAYGSSESLLGEILPAPHQFKIVTKTNKIEKPVVSDDDVELVLANFHRSLHQLQQSAVYGLLVHHVDDLLAVGGERLFGRLELLKAEGLVEKLGVSVYDREQAEKLLDKYAIDLIQIPLNVFDQRMLKNDYLSFLKKAGVEIHVRSVFLQGLLLMSENNLPSYLLDLAPHLSNYRQANEQRGISNLQAALGFVNQIEQVDALLVGVNNLPQLREIVGAMDSSLDLSYLDSLAVASAHLVNPSLWRK